MESVFSQSFTDYEYIVVDGGSTDGSRKFIEDHKDHLCWWVSEKDKGKYDAMNKGIARANGELLMFLNSGDYLLNHDVLSKAFEIINHISADIYYGDIEIKGSPDNQLIKMPPKLNLYYWKNNNINHQSAFYKRKIFYEISAYSSKFQLASDQEFNIRAFIKGYKFYHLDFPLVFYDVTGTSSRNFESYRAEMNQVYNELVPQTIQKIINEHHYYENLLKQKIMSGALRVNSFYHKIRGK